MTPPGGRRYVGERWWGGYLIRLEEDRDGHHYRIRRELNLQAPPEAWQWSGGPFPSDTAAHEAAVAHIIELERSRAGSRDAVL